MFAGVRDRLKPFTHISAIVNNALAPEESMRYCAYRTERLEEGG